MSGCLELVRRPDWLLRLHAYVEARRHRAFAWGLNDCCLFAADGVREITGIDLAATWRNAYRSKAEAAAVLKELGGVEKLPERVGLVPQFGPLNARRGDVVLYATDNGPTLGLCLGAKFAAPGKDRLLFLPLDGATHAWSVG